MAVLVFASLAYDILSFVRAKSYRFTGSLKCSISVRMFAIVRVFTFVTMLMGDHTSILFAVDRHDKLRFGTFMVQVFGQFCLG